MVGRVQIGGVTPTSHYQLKEAVQADERFNRFLAFEDERRDGLCFQFARRPRTSIEEGAWIAGVVRKHYTHTPDKHNVYCTNNGPAIRRISVYLQYRT